MKNTILLSKYFAKTLIRDKVVVSLILFLPVILVFAGAASAPNRELMLVLDDQIINPFPTAKEISVTLYTITAVVLVASLVSFFLGFNLKKLIPRLKQVNYTSLEIVLSFIAVMLVINLSMSLVVGLFSLIWIDVNNYFGFMVGLILSSIIFSTLGLIIAELVDTTTLGLYGILVVAVLDTGFLENPVYSRRYNEDWISIMPSHESIQLVLRTVLDTGTDWTNNLFFIIGYEMILIILYFIISKYRIGFGNN
jgi:hypothetical protein